MPFPGLSPLALSGGELDVPVLVGTNTDSRSGSQFVSLDLPTGAQEGDHLIAFTFRNSSFSASSSPAGWSLVNSASGGGWRLDIWRKVAGPSEPSSYSWNFQPANITAGIIAAYRGRAGLVSDSSCDARASDWISFGPSISPGRAGRLIFFGVSTTPGKGVGIEPADMTSVASVSLNVSARLYEQERPNRAMTTGNRTLIWSPNNPLVPTAGALIQIY